MSLTAFCIITIIVLFNQLLFKAAHHMCLIALGDPALALGDPALALRDTALALGDTALALRDTALAQSSVENWAIT